MLAIVLVMFLVLLLAGFPIIVSMGIPALLYVIVAVSYTTSPSPRDGLLSRMPSSA